MIGVLVTELFDEKQTSATQPRAEDHDGRDIRYIIIIQGGYTLKKKNIAAAMLAASMPLLSISAAHATPDTASTTPSQTQQQGEQRETEQSTSKQDVEVTQELVEKYSQYVSQEGDQFRLNAPENLKSDNAQEVSKVQEIINNTNEDIASGQTEVTDNESDDQTVETAAGKHKASGSHGGYEYKWWGIQFWLDEWATQEYTNSLSQGVSADKIAADFCAWTGIKNKTVVKVSQTLRIDAKIVRTSNWQNKGIIVNAPVGKFTRAWCQPRHADTDTPDVQKHHTPHKPQKPE